MSDTCPACGFEAPASNYPAHAYLAASPACWEQFNKSLALHYEDFRFWPAHQIMTDAYCLQHSTGDDRRSRKSALVHLAGLVFQFDNPGSEDVVTSLRSQVAERPDFEKLEPWPETTACIGTVATHADDPEGHVSSARAFAHQVYLDWGAFHDHARQIVIEVLG